MISSEILNLIQNCNMPDGLMHETNKQVMNLATITLIIKLILINIITYSKLSLTEETGKLEVSSNDCRN
jgi:hypothetical protein